MVQSVVLPSSGETAPLPTGRTLVAEKGGMAAYKKATLYPEATKYW